MFQKVGGEVEEVVLKTQEILLVIDGRMGSYILSSDSSWKRHESVMSRLTKSWTLQRFGLGGYSVNRHSLC